ncbi:hypothetical protein IG631_00627 [Alternaria alternata]|nr:hypothetical protein IG631_00627 [Alternaria alternata]
MHQARTRRPVEDMAMGVMQVEVDAIGQRRRSFLVCNGSWTKTGFGVGCWKRSHSHRKAWPVRLSDRDFALGHRGPSRATNRTPHTLAFL